MKTGKRDKAAIKRALDQTLSAIIDDWYERVSGYYVTLEDEDPDEDAELKRFHDSKGHRIKFNKDDLDFTYGLRSTWHGNRLSIEISVNNKVDNFDYDNFRTQLFAHYQKAGLVKATRPASFAKAAHKDLFQLESGIREAFTVEKRNDKADIMRLSFVINPEFLDTLASEQEAAKLLIENYCVSPFRRIYANVYRSA